MFHFYHLWNEFGNYISTYGKAFSILSNAKAFGIIALRDAMYNQENCRVPIFAIALDM